MISEKEGRSCSIVLIDDDKIIHFIFEKLISTLYPGKSFLCFSSAEQVLHLLQSNALVTDLIILDVNMPHMNGWAFLERLKEINYLKPVCMLSSSTNARDVERSKDFTIVKGYVVKPLDALKLEEILKIS